VFLNLHYLLFGMISPTDLTNGLTAFFMDCAAVSVFLCFKSS
jgi:hypothetical protein